MDCYTNFLDIVNFKFNMKHVYNLIDDNNFEELNKLVRDDRNTYISLKRFIFYSLFLNKTECCLVLLNNVEDFDEFFFMGNNYLQASSEFNNFKVTKFLLEKGADPNTVTSNFCCPLVNAVKFCNDKMVDILLEHGANVNVLVYFPNELLFYDRETLTKEVVETMCYKELSIFSKNFKGTQYSDLINQRKFDCLRPLFLKIPVINLIKYICNYL